MPSCLLIYVNSSTWSGCKLIKQIVHRVEKTENGCSNYTHCPVSQMPSHQPGHTSVLRAGDGVNPGISFHTLGNQHLDPEPACVKAGCKGEQKCSLTSALKYFAQTALKSSQALTYHWDFQNPPSCKDGALVWTEQSCFPLSAAASSLEDLPSATGKALNSPDPPHSCQCFPPFSSSSCYISSLGCLQNFPYAFKPPRQMGP